MKIKLVYITIMLFTNYAGLSQLETNHNYRNRLYLEAGGYGGYGSLNYERIIRVKSKLKVGLRIGLSTYNLKDYTNKLNPDVIIPLGVSGFYGSNHKVEFGIGQTITNFIRFNNSTWKSERKTNLHTSFTIGYRFQTQNGRLIVGCRYTPLIEYYKYFRHWGGVSIGFAF